MVVQREPDGGVTKKVVRKKRIIKVKKGSTVGTKPLPEKEGFFSRLLSSLAGKAKKAKATVGAKSGLKPVLSLESRLTIPRIRELLRLIWDRLLPTLLPDLSAQSVLEVGEYPLVFKQCINDKKPRLFCGLVVGSGGEASAGTFPLISKGTFRSFPFGDDFFDSVVCQLASPYQEDVVSAFKEVGRVLAGGGVGYIFDFHPFGLYAKSGTDRLRSYQSTIRGLEDYFKMCQVGGLGVEDVREGFLDDTLRNRFTTPEDTALFRELKGTPLLLFLKVSKNRKQT